MNEPRNHPFKKMQNENAEQVEVQAASFFERFNRLRNALREQASENKTPYGVEDRLAELVIEIAIDIHRQLQHANSKLEHQNTTLFNTLVQATVGFDATNMGEQSFDIATLLRVSREQRMADFMYAMMVLSHLHENGSDFALEAEGLELTAQSHYKLMQFAQMISRNINATMTLDGQPLGAEQAQQGTNQPSKAEDWGNCPAEKQKHRELERAKQEKAAELNQIMRDAGKLVEDAAGTGSKGLTIGESLIQAKQKTDLLQTPVRNLTIGTIQNLISKARDTERSKVLADLQAEIDKVNKAVLSKNTDSVIADLKPNLETGALEGNILFKKSEFPTLDEVAKKLFPTEPGFPANEEDKDPRI